MDERWIVATLIGAYVGVLVGTATAVVGLASTTVGTPLLIAVAVGVAAVVTGAARQVDRLVDRVISIPLAVVTVGVPLLYIPYLMVASEPVTMAAIVGLLAIIPGIGIPISGAGIRNQRRREQADEIAVITVGEDDDSDESNWSAVGGVVVAGVSIVAAMGAGFAGIEDHLGTLLSSLGGAATSVAFFGDDDAEVAVTDIGLRVDNSVLLWDDLDGYRITDDELELVRPEWYHPSQTFDREEITDDDALIEELEAFLPRLDKHGRVELTPRRTRR